MFQPLSENAPDLWRAAEISAAAPLPQQPAGDFRSKKTTQYSNVDHDNRQFRQLEVAYGPNLRTTHRAVG